MNKIYKVIYSKVRNCYVVVSELAKNHSHGTKADHTARKGTALTAALLLALSCASVLGAPGAEAATKTDGSNFIGVERTDGTFEDSSYKNYNGGGAEGPQSITIGTAAEAGNSTITIGDRRAGASIGCVYVGQGDIKNPFTDRGGWVTSVGYNSDATGYGSIAIGSNAIAKNDIKQNIELSNASGDLNDNPTIKGASVALGYSASAADGSIAIGSYSVATAAASTANAKFRDNTASDYAAPTSYVSVGSDTVKRRITNVAAGTDDNDVATVGQLSYVEQEAQAKGSWKLTAGKANESTVTAGSTVDFSAGADGNLSVSKDKDSNNVIFGLAKDLTGITSISGSTDNNGAKITLGTTDKNINVNNGKITGLADGDVSEKSTDAVTGKQLYSVRNDVDDLTMRSVKYDLTGSGVASGPSPDYSKITLQGSNGTTIVKLADGIRIDAAVNVHQLRQKADLDAGNIGSNYTPDLKDDSGEVIYYTDRLDKDSPYYVNASDSKYGTPVTLTDAIKLEKDETKKAALQKQLDEARNANENTWGTNIGTGKITNKADEGSGQLVTGGTVYSEVRPTTDGTYVKKANTTGDNLLALDDQVKQNAQRISDNTYTAGDGIKMDPDTKKISAVAGKGITVDTNGINVKTGNGLEIAQDGSVAIKTSDSNLKVDKNGIGLSDTVTIGSTDGKKVTIDGTTGEVSGLTNTKWDTTADYSTSTKAATESQVAAAVQDAVKQAGDNDVDTHVKAGSYGVDDKHQVSMDLVDKKGKATGDKVTITDVAKASEVGDVTKLDKGVQNATGTTTVVDAINNVNTSMNTKIGDQKYSTSNTSGSNKYVSDGDSITSAIGKLDGAVQQAASAAGKHATVSEGSNIKVDGNVQSDGHTDYKVSLKDDISLNSVTTKTATTDTLTVNNSANIGGVTIENKTVSGLDDTTIEKGSTKAVNAGTIWNELRPSGGTYINQNNTTAQNLTNLDTQVKKNSDLVNSDGSTIKIGSKDSAAKVDISDKNGKGRVVTGVVTDTNDANSAANVGYVNNMAAANTQQIYRDMNNAYGRLDNNINRAAAGSNALAALHPLEYDPDDKLSFAMGYGHYHNANAAAVGAFYQPNSKTQFNFGVALGNGDPGFNAGIAFKLGKPSPYAGMNRVTLIHTVQDLKASDEAKDKRIDALEKENQEMKKQLQAILAKLNG